MYTIPLRRALVTNSTLPYPEGVAAAEVLKVGVGSRSDGVEGSATAEGRTGLLTVVWGSVLSAGFAAITGAKVFAGEVGTYFRVGPSIATGVSASMSLALVGAGHLMGIAVGVAMFVGLVISWGFAVPILTYLHPVGGTGGGRGPGGLPARQVRFFGAGAIGTAAVWTLGKLAIPVWGGLVSAVDASRKTMGGHGSPALPRAERDIPIWIVGLICLVTLPPMAWLLHNFLNGGPLQGMIIPLMLGGVAYIAIVGFLVAAVCGYMAGLIGSSNSPVSGLAILAVLGAAVLLALFAKASAGPERAESAGGFFTCS